MTSERKRWTVCRERRGILRDKVKDGKWKTAGTEKERWEVIQTKTVGRMEDRKVRQVKGREMR